MIEYYISLKGGLYNEIRKSRKGSFQFGGKKT